ncbi:MAG: histidine ammonia-lyase [Vicinamibacteraceae bacterium]|nr:histidine ammonia-lyase [Vicinamibacteraceae bacterium]
MAVIILDGHALDLPALVTIAEQLDEPVTIADEALAGVDRSRAVVDALAAGEAAVYGVNTGFGFLADVRIPADALGRLQVNLVRSHAAGVGDPLPVSVVRAMMALRANVLAKGFSGIRRETLQRLVAMLNAGVHPVVPRRGSVGASGDLAPLAHLALVLIGEGEALHAPGARVVASEVPPAAERLPGGEALARAGLEPVVLEAKEGLALINGTQASTAVLALALARAWRLARAADVVAAMSIDALRGSWHPFEARLHEPRNLEGQSAAAANLCALLQGSAINRSHEHCGKVQDAYALRCAAQVHGAAREGLAFVLRLVEAEMNAATDNPMVFADTGDMVSGGNFHGAPVALAADTLAIAVTHLATISERRCDRLMNPAMSDLPPFLTRDSGLHSGYMMAQVTAAALTSELKSLAHPASVDTIPTSAGKEDHVSMSMTAALKAYEAVDLATRVLAIEALAAAQGLDLLAPLTSSNPLEGVHRAIRDVVPTLTDDRPPSPDIERIAGLIAHGVVERRCGIEVK